MVYIPNNKILHIFYLFLFRGVVKLELRCPQNVNGIIIVNPKSDWSFEALMSKLNSLELKLGSLSKFHVHFTKRESRYSILFIGGIGLIKSLFGIFVI